MNKSFYQSKIEDMLSNQEYNNEQLDNDPHKPIMATYKKLVHKITKREFEYLTYFYSLPQIHISKEINEECTGQFGRNRSTR